MPLFADASEWTAAGVGGVLTVVIGLLGTWYLKIMAARAAIERERMEAEAKAKVAALAAERRDKRDTTDELYKLLDAKEKDIQEYRTLIHGFRGDMGLLSNRLAICEWDRARQRLAIEDQGEALRKAGIVVHYRAAPDAPGPVELHGPDEPGEAGK